MEAVADRRSAQGPACLEALLDVVEQGVRAILLAGEGRQRKREARRAEDALLVTRAVECVARARRQVAELGEALRDRGSHFDRQALRQELLAEVALHAVEQTLGRFDAGALGE